MTKTSKILIAVICVLIIGAAFITYEVGVVWETEPLDFDLSVQKAIFSLRSDSLNAIMIPITHLADTKTIVAFCAMLLILPTRKKYGLPLSLACISGVLIYKPMKELFLRARPDISLHLVEQGGFSFPSGHSTTSVIFYGFSIYLINKHCKNQKLKVVLTVICAMLAVLIGPSRIYVGVHWPTDVLAGWCVGGAVLAAAIIISERIRKKNESL